MNASVHLKRRMSRAGLVLCAVYLLIIAACLVLSLSSDGDPKGRFVFMQLPIAPQMSLMLPLLRATGLLPLLAETGWAVAYLLLGLPTFVALYALGWAAETALRKGTKARATQ